MPSLSVCSCFLLRNLFVPTVGTFGPPTDLTVTIQEDSMIVQLSWTPPFTHFDLLGYIVKIQESSHVRKVSTVLSHHSFHFSDLNITDRSRCTTSYQISLSVCGVNQTGEGQFANITLNIPKDDRGCLVSITQGT